MRYTFDKDHQIVLKRTDLHSAKIDIGGRDIIIAFNEPAFKVISTENRTRLDSKLNARFITFFLPAVEIAMMQSKRSRLILVSALNMAFLWNSSSEEERKIMAVNNNLKLDFLKCFFEWFYPDTFSIIETVVSQDPIKIDEDKLLTLWQLIERKNKKVIDEIKLQLARFIKPKLFNQQSLSATAKAYLESASPELLNSFKYAISHLFALGDINFEGNFIHNPIGYLSIGGIQEKTFNCIRTYAYELLKDDGESFFGRKILFKNNLMLVIENIERTPPPYNGYYRNNGDRYFLDEVTYENGKNLDFYDDHKKLKFEMKYMYQYLVSKADYEEFWNKYKKRYFDLKSRYTEAFQVL